MNAKREFRVYTTLDPALQRAPPPPSMLDENVDLLLRKNTKMAKD